MQPLDSQTAVKEAIVLDLLPTASVNQTARYFKTVATISELFVVSTHNHGYYSNEGQSVPNYEGPVGDF